MKSNKLSVLLIVFSAIVLFFSCKFMVSNNYPDFFVTLGISIIFFGSSYDPFVIFRVFKKNIPVELLDLTVNSTCQLINAIGVFVLFFGNFYKLVVFIG